MSVESAGVSVYSCQTRDWGIRLGMKRSMKKYKFELNMFVDKNSIWFNNWK